MNRFNRAMQGVEGANKRLPKQPQPFFRRCFPLWLDQRGRELIHEVLFREGVEVRFRAMLSVLLLRFITFSFALLFFFVSTSEAQDPSRIDPLKAAMLSALFPGGGHFYLGEKEKGLAYLGSEMSLALGAIFLENELAKKPNDELNPLFLLALKGHELGVYTAYRSARLMTQNRGYETPVDESPLSDFLLAPFRLDHLLHPYVYLGALAGAALTLGEVFLENPKRRYGDIRSVRAAGIRSGREGGLLLYEADLALVSLSAAVGEEGIWRGLLQTEAERSFGSTRGWLFTSFLFGLAHLFNPNVELTSGKTLYQVSVASLGGLYLGWIYQKEHYQLSRSIATHFWFNIFAGTTAFLLDPKENPLGVRVEFRF